MKEASKYIFAREFKLSRVILNNVSQKKYAAYF